MSLDCDTLEQLLDTVRRFVHERLIPNEQRLAEEDRVPLEIVAEIRNLGLFGLSVPAPYGGLGLSLSEEVQVLFEFARAAPAFRGLIATNKPEARHPTRVSGDVAQNTVRPVRDLSGRLRVLS